MMIHFSPSGLLQKLLEDEHQDLPFLRRRILAVGQCLFWNEKSSSTSMIMKRRLPTRQISIELMPAPRMERSTSGHTRR